MNPLLSPKVASKTSSSSTFYLTNNEANNNNSNSNIPLSLSTNSFGYGPTHSITSMPTSYKMPANSATPLNSGMQAQFELSVELRRFVNIDLFQRGYYQIRVQAKIGNKQIPSKIQVQLEPNKNNNDLSDAMFPSCTHEDYGVSKTFLILYRNEEIILDDHLIFKVSALVNAFNLVESFEKLDLQLNIELWFTENDYKPAAVTLLNIVNSIAQSNQSFENSTNSNENSSASKITVNTASSMNEPSSSSNSSLNSMQMLCSRNFKIHFDARQGIHLQVPVLFDYFHLSAVSVTIHCVLLTLLPPVSFGTTLRNSSLSSILYGKELNQFKSLTEINDSLMKRAVYVHNEICKLLLTSYEHLQDHITKMSLHLSKYDRKKIKLDYVNCSEKLHKLNQIVQNCSDPEALDDLANRHIAQCSAENIMLWCIYLENFTMNLYTSSILAIDYHNKRLKRFSESFFFKDLPKKSLQEYEASDNYVSLNDILRQTPYFLQLADLVVACDDLDGTPENQPIIFEENYISHKPSTSTPSPLVAGSALALSSLIGITHIKEASHFLEKSKFFYSPNNGHGRSKAGSKNKCPADTYEQQRKSSISSSENTSLNTHSSFSNSHSDNVSNQLHKKLKKKLNKGREDGLFANAENSSITLVSYRKVNNYLNSDDALGVSSGGSVSEDVFTGSMPSKMRTQLSSSSLTSNSSSVYNEPAKHLHSITEMNMGNDSKTRDHIEEDSPTVFSLPGSTSSTNPGSTSLFRRSLHLKSSKKYNFNNHHHSSMKETSSSSAKKQSKSLDLEKNSAFDIANKNSDNPLDAKAKDETKMKDAASAQSASAGSTLDEIGTVEKVSNDAQSSKADSTTVEADAIVESSMFPCLTINDIEVNVNENVENNKNELFNNHPEPDECIDHSLLHTPSNKLNVNEPTDASSPAEDDSKNDGSQPIDCSSKSRVLYESFRGKVNTLERPRRVRRSLNGLINNSTSVSNTDELLASHMKANKIVEINSKCGSLNSSLNATNTNNSTNNTITNTTDLEKKDSNNTKEEAEFDIAQSAASNSSGIGSSVIEMASKSSIKSNDSSVGVVKNKLKKQLTINTDLNSLSSTILFENVYKFVIFKEEVKKTLLSKKYQGNIYSEFMKLFCQNAPYFYLELTPKLTDTDIFHQHPKSFHEEDSRSSFGIDRKRSNTFLEQSRSKLRMLFSHKQNEESSSSNHLSKGSKRLDSENDDDEHHDYDVDEDTDDDESDDIEEKLHLVVCVHGLDGNSGDLRLVRTYIELALPGAKLDFLMSEHNQESTFDDIEKMALQLIKEISDYFDIFGIDPERISFIGHSLGNLIIRTAVSHENFRPYVNKLHTYLSLSGPHLGTLYNSSGLINMGLWIMQKWKKSGSLLQLTLKDNSDLNKTFLYKLSTKPTFEYFRHILLVASPQDRYVPFHSARIDMCKPAMKDNLYGQTYREMLKNILKPIQESTRIQTFKRYSVFHTLPSGTSNFIGRAAHIAVLDSELFVEKLVLVSVAKYFR